MGESLWPERRLGDILRETNDRAGDRVDLPVLSVTKSRGPMLASERFGKALHGRDLGRYRVARRGQVVVDPMLLWDGSLGVQDVVDAGLVSPDYRVYDAATEATGSYLNYALRSPSMVAKYAAGARGTNVRRNRIARGDFESIPFRLPSLPEQRKIAAILSSVDNAIEKTQAVIDQAQMVKKGLMQQLLTRGMPIGRRQQKVLNGDWRLGRVADVREIPHDWELVTLTSVARLESGHTPSRRCPEYWDGQIPWVSLHDSKQLDVPEIHETAQTIGPLGLENSSARLLPKGTVVFSRTATVGKATVMGREMATSQDFANYVCGPRLYNRYLMHLFRHMQREWDRLMAGSTHQTIYMPVFEQLQVLLPSLEEQKEIAAIADACEARISCERAVIEGLKVTKAGLLSEVLSGRLQVQGSGGEAA